LRNELLPIVTITGLQLGAMLGGSVVIETIFAWPGMGRLAFDAIFRRDLNLLLGILFISSFLVIIANIVTDLIYARLDPRIELK
jgi:peptide/nickel transport system permease protein